MRLGEFKYNSYGEKVVITKYNNAKDIELTIGGNYKTKSSYRNFKSSEQKSPYAKTVFGVGYIGVGKYKPWKNGKNTIQYSYWFHMMRRGYSDEYKERFNSYNYVTIDMEWHCFQNFAKWFDENSYMCPDRMELDKDLLFKNNKTYSSKTCCFLPRRINSLLINSKKIRGGYPIGVYYNKRLGKFVSQINKNKRITIGRYDNPMDAFIAYKTEKESYIKEVANEYKDIIPYNVYCALMNYVIDIND